MRLRKLSATTTVLALLCLMYGITYIDRVNVSTAASAFQRDLHLNNTQVGLVFSAFAYPYLIFQIIGGWVSDRFGARRTLTVSAIIWALSTLLTGLVSGLGTLLFARVMLGFGEGATFPTATRALSDWTAKGSRGFAQGITHSSARLGNAITPPLVVWLMTMFTWRGSFFILGAVSFAWAVAWIAYFRDDPRNHPHITPRELEDLPSYGQDLKNSALFSAGVFFGGVVGDAVGGAVSDRILRKTGDPNKARRNLVVGCFICSLLSMIPVLFIHDVNWAAIFLSLGFFWSEFTVGAMWAIPMDIAPRFSGSASGLMNSGSALAAILSPLIFGYVIDRTGNWELPFLGSIGLLVLGSIAAFWMKPGEKLAIGQLAETPTVGVVA